MSTAKETVTVAELVKVAREEGLQVVEDEPNEQSVQEPKHKPSSDSTTSWDPVDIRELMAQGLTVDPPSVLQRTDGQPMFYAGKVNEIHGEPEAGKGWLLSMATAETLSADEHSLYVDFEDDFAMLFERLMAHGVEEERIAEYLTYLRPTEPLGSRATRASLERVLGTSYRFAALDGLNEALELQSLRSGETDDIATFFRLLPNVLSDTGAATVLSDHVTKSRENRRYAIGSQHKKAQIRGASYLVEPELPMGRRRRGTSTLVVAKDTPGWIRQHATSDGKRFGLLVVDNTQPDSTVAHIEPPSAGSSSDGGRTRAKSETSILRVLNGEAHPLAKREIVDRIVAWIFPAGMTDKTFERATKRLLDDGRIDRPDSDAGKPHLWWRTDVAPDFEATRDSAMESEAT